LTDRLPSIDGIAPDKVLRPDSIDDLGRQLSSERGSIVPAGACTQTFFGNPLISADCAVDLRGLSRITEYNPADVTVHAEAGVTLDSLQQVLLRNNQFLPLDPWIGGSATIGGVVAANAQGPYRAVGTIRDWIIGMTVVHVDGRISKTGGRVVKNVTGYDLAKLYTGSLGSLAIVGEVSLKLRTNYAKTATVIAQFQDAKTAANAVREIRMGPLQPVSCEWTGPGNAVWLRFGETPEAVDWQLRHLPPGDWTRAEEAEWNRLRDVYDGMGPIVLKVIGMPAASDAIVEEFQPRQFIAHALNGIVLMAVSGREEVERVRRKYRAVIERAPIEIRREIGTFGLNDTEFVLMKKLKDAFDPEGRLNPGRHVDGERRH
jgi:glycolate oxidase FAD binding subunit